METSTLLLLEQNKLGYTLDRIILHSPVTARRDTMMVHVQRSHKEHHNITQVDSACWEKLRDTHPIPQQMPALPIVPLNEDRKRSRASTPTQKVQLQDTAEKEVQVIKVTKLTTPPRKRPALAPRQSLKQKLARKTTDIYVPTPLVELKAKEIESKLKCKRNQRNELQKITAAMDPEIQGLVKELQAIRKD